MTPMLDSSDQDLLDGLFSQSIDSLTALRHAMDTRESDLPAGLWLASMIAVDTALIHTRTLLCACGQHVAVGVTGECSMCETRVPQVREAAKGAGQ